MKQKQTIKIMSVLDYLYLQLYDEIGRTFPEQLKTLHEDVFSMMYSPTYEINPEGENIGQIQIIESMEEYKNLKETTTFNDIYSYIAATTLLEKLPPPPKNPKPPPSGTPQPPNDQQNTTPDTNKNGPKNAQNTLKKEIIRTALEETKRELEKTKNSLSSMGIEPGELKNLPLKDKVKIIQHMLRHKEDTFKKVLNLANKLLANAKNAMVNDPEYLPTKISKVTRSDDVSHLADPSVLLDDDLFYSALSEKKLLTYDIKDRWDKKRGPLVVLVDTSGSMSGNREVWAKAVALALRKIAKEQKRRVRVILFSERTYTIDFKNSGNEIDQITDLIEKSFGGGTSFESPYVKAIEAIEKENDFHHASIILITDGESTDISKDTINWLNSFLKENNKNIVITIDMDKDTSETIQRLIPMNLLINIDSSKPTASDKMIEILKGEMYVRNRLFRSDKHT